MTKLDTKKFIKPNEVILKLRGITKLYPGVVAVDKINMDIKRGEVHGIIGKNGAGKSTLVGIIAGIITPTEGDIFIGKDWYKTLSRIEAKKKKIEVITQEPQVVPDQTVAEGLFSPNYIHSSGFINWGKMYKEAKKILESSKILKIDPKIKLGDLNISEQQLLLVYKAFYIEDANIVILDETTASLTQYDQRILFDLINIEKEKGRTILFISHRMSEILKVCDRVSVLRDGRLVANESCKSLNLKKLSSFIVGRDMNNHYIYRESGKKSKIKEKDIVLSIKGFTKVGVFENIDFQLKRGEILGLAGLRGSGRTEILKAIVGAETKDYGHIELSGQKKNFTHPCDALKEGLVYLPEEREKEGLVGILSVMDNLTLSMLCKFCYFTKSGIINERERYRISKKLIKDLQIKAYTHTQEVNNLSGGNKQKVVIGKILIAQPKVFLLDEPTRGIDIAARESILRMIREDLSKSAGVIITSPGLKDLLDICDRILVLYRGKVKKIFSRKEFDENKIYLAIQGVQ